MRSVCVVLACVVSLAVSGCGRDPAACRDRVARMRETLATASGHRIGTPNPTVPLARAEHGRVPDAASSFVVLGSPAVAHLDGRPFQRERVADLRADLEVVRRNWRILHPRRPQLDPWPVYLWIGAGTSVAAVQPWIDALAPGYELRLVVEPPTPAPSRAPAAARELYPAIANVRDPLRISELIAGAWSDAIRTCSHLSGRFAVASSMSNAERWAQFARGVPDAIELCGCDGVDPDRVEALLLLSRVSEGPDVRWLPLVRGPEGTPPQAPGTTVRDLVRALDRAPDPPGTGSR